MGWPVRWGRTPGAAWVVAGVIAAGLFTGGCGEDGAAAHQAQRGSADRGAGDSGPRDSGPPDADPGDARTADARPAPDADRDAAPRSDAFDLGPADAAAPGDLGPRPTAAECQTRGRPAGFVALGPDHDALGIVMGHHCLGSDHQTIEGVQRVVFLGDSITAGTPPTARADWYRSRVGAALTARFGPDLVVDSCAKFGARTDDFLEGKNEISECFPEGGDARRTLVIFTIGGNDIAKWAQERYPLDRAMAEAEAAATLLDEAVVWLKDPARFPNGSDVIFANPYEYTDGTGDLASCELATFAGLEGNWIQGSPAILRLAERFTEIAVAHQVDVALSFEQFCGHGYRRDDPEGPCFLGADAELWFDPTCIHPNTAGHRTIADLFLAIVDE